MTAVKLGMFTMPFHHPHKDYAALLAEDQEAVILADRLGFSEAYVGEHFSSWSERITSPLNFLATVIPLTKQIRLGTGVLNLPQVHPGLVAAHAAMFDQLSGGRFIMGIGPGGLVSDLEMFEVGQAELRPQMVQESIDIVLRLWAQDPPYEIDGRFWKFALKDNIWPEFKVAISRARSSSRIRPSRYPSSRPTRRAPRWRESEAGSPSPATSSTSATSAATGRSTSRAAKRPAAGPTRASGACRAGCW
jgi:Luciferase-like monooxygenase